MDDIVFNTNDPFEETSIVSEKVHIRVQKRNGRKSITIISGLSELKPLLKKLKKKLSCNGTIIDDEKHGKILQLQGDHRYDIRDYLITQDLAEDESIIIHGF